MKTLTTLIAAALVAGSASMALAQAGMGAGSSGGGSASGGSSTPSLDTSRTGAPAPVLRRGDQMAPMQQSNVSNRMMMTHKKKHSMRHRNYR